MSTQSIAVENMVVAALRNLMADESALQGMFEEMHVSARHVGGSEALLTRLMDLDLRASRIERLLDAMEHNGGWQLDSASC